ncbi:protein DpdG [Gluconacetobacter sp. Hr-1-5]|uniref:protein DpdG n=1 Tax=Gluconacetobacter sp. Hr-1-5 TaxID=3395370 RepID=UPI003B517602
MSILNQASDGLFNVLIVLVRVLIRFGPKGRDDLILACGGAAGAFDTSQLTRTLNRWTELGLFGEENGSIIIAASYRSALGKNADEAETRLPKVARTIALSPANNARFWESEGAKSADLSRGVAWMLAQDVYTLDVNSDRLAEMEGHQLIDSSAQKIAQNNTRWNGLKTWMLYLGFARDGVQWVVDPTQALRETLPDIFGSNRELPAPAFVERAAGVLPVFDGGAYRVQVEAALKESAWPRLRAGLISSSLSRAIQRLDREGFITLLSKSDTEGVVSLTGTNARTWRDVSHVALTQAGKAR